MKSKSATDEKIMQAFAQLVEQQGYSGPRPLALMKVQSFVILAISLAWQPG